MVRQVDHLYQNKAPPHTNIITTNPAASICYHVDTIEKTVALCFHVHNSLRPKK